MTEKNIVSPCISVCKTDPVSGFCYGCGRSNDDKKLWKDENTSDEWKLNNIEELKERLNGWQREAFEASYKSCLLYTSPSPRDAHESRMPSSA